MLDVDVRMDISRALAKLDRVAREVADKATMRALNKVADQAKVRAAREIRDAGYGIKIGRIKSAISIKRASEGRLVAVVRALGRPIPLIEFDAKEDRKGRVTVKVKNGRKAVRDGFIATMPTGHRGIFRRVGNQRKRVIKTGKVMWSGLPIKELYGPSIPAAFANQIVMDTLEALVREKFPAIFASEIRYLAR